VLGNEFLRNYEQCTDVMGIQELYKTMEPVVKDKYLFITTELGHHLLVIHLVSFLEWTQARAVVVRQGS
jgi:hypothetical protein